MLRKTCIASGHPTPVTSPEPDSDAEEGLHPEITKESDGSDASTEDRSRGERRGCGLDPEELRSEISKEPVEPDTGVEDCGRERLKRHRVEMAGRVWIPEVWGQESLLKDWVDCSAFDSSLVPNGLGSAREALVEGCRRSNPVGLRIENRVEASL